MKPGDLKRLDRELTAHVDSLIEGMGRPERREAMAAYVTGLLLDGDRKSIPKDDRDHTRLEAARAKVIQLFETAVGIERVRGTAWAAFQGWTEYADHHRPVRDTGREDLRRARLASIWMGRAANMKQAALRAIADEANVQLAAA